MLCLCRLQIERFLSSDNRKNWQFIFSQRSVRMRRRRRGEEKKEKNHHMELYSRWKKFPLLTMRAAVVFCLSLLSFRCVRADSRVVEPEEKCLFSPFMLSKKKKSFLLARWPIRKSNRLWSSDNLPINKAWFHSSDSREETTGRVYRSDLFDSSEMLNPSLEVDAPGNDSLRSHRKHHRSRSAPNRSLFLSFAVRGVRR